MAGCGSAGYKEAFRLLAHETTSHCACRRPPAGARVQSLDRGRVERAPQKAAGERSVRPPGIGDPFELLR
jgi:hypothetical protein